MVISDLVKCVKESKIIGIGLKNNDGDIKINNILSNTPASRSNLEVGDILVNVDCWMRPTKEEVKQSIHQIKLNSICNE